MTVVAEIHKILNDDKPPDDPVHQPTVSPHPAAAGQPGLAGDNDGNSAEALQEPEVEEPEVEPVVGLSHQDSQSVGQVQDENKKVTGITNCNIRNNYMMKKASFKNLNAERHSYCIRISNTIVQIKQYPFSHDLLFLYYDNCTIYNHK